MFATIDLEKRDGIGTLWMNRPELHNAFNPQLIAEIEAGCRQLEADPEVRVVVLAGRGKSFSAGADLAWMKAAGEAGIDDNCRDAEALAGMLRTLAHLSKPTIARVHGAALGGGMGLASACDICVAAEQAVFATTEVRFGIIPAAISPYVLRAIGERQCGRYFLTAERIPAAQALRLGLAHEVVPAETLDDTVNAIAAALIQGGPEAQKAAKALIRAVAHRPVDDGLVIETARRIAHLRASPEAREGLAAFLDKRPPRWIAKD